jgi:hypothetical protein
MLHPSTKKLIDKIAEMTRRQRVAWVQGDDGRIYHDTEGYRVVLTPAPHAVLVTDALGKTIESALPEHFAAELDGAGRPYAQHVSELYRDADRYARGAERAIDMVLKGLDRDGDGIPDDAPTGVIAGAGVAAAAVPMADRIEDLADETQDLSDIGAAAETDAVEQMTAAVASMANEVNAAEPEQEQEPEPAIVAETPAPAADVIPVVNAAAVEDAWTVVTPPEPVSLAAPGSDVWVTHPQDDALAEPAGDFEAGDAASLIADALTLQELQTPAEDIEGQEATFVQVPPETAFAEVPDAPAPTAPEPVPASPAATDPFEAPAPVPAFGGGGFFGGRGGGFGAYSRAPAPAAPPEPAATEPTVAAPPQRFSLSGLGAPAIAAVVNPPEPAPELVPELVPERVPEVVPEPVFIAAPAIAAETKPATTDAETFIFETDAPTPLLPPISEDIVPPAPVPEPVHAVTADAETAPARPAMRPTPKFNPWN